MYARLHDIHDSFNFLGAFWELVIFRYLHENRHEVDYNERINGKTPDFFWKRHDLIGDVVSISDPDYGRKPQAHLDELLRLLHREPFPFNIFITTFAFRDGRNPKLRAIVDWLQGLAQSTNEDLYHQAQEFESEDSRLEVILQPSSLASGGVKVVGMFELDDDQRKIIIKGRLEEKVKKYRRSLVVFAGKGFGLWPVDDRSLNESLYGDERISISRAGGQGWTHLDRAWNGVFHNRKGRNGFPANTELSAVVLAAWRTEEENLIVNFGVYHNAHASRRLPREFFAPMQQFMIINKTSDQFTLGWVEKNDGFIVGQHRET